MNIAKNRQTFLDALRSDKYPKGPIEVDDKGHPTDPNAYGFCVDGLAYALFRDEDKPGSLVPVRAALGFSQDQFARLQQVLNDSPLTFPEIADLIEDEY